MITSPLWLPATLIAGAFQAWRTAVQKRVSHDLTISAAGLVRYLYGLPVAALLLLAYQATMANSVALPTLRSVFWFHCLLGGTAQIIATNLLIMAFNHRNFVVGTAYSKTEAVQAAIVSALFLGERLPLLAWAGIGCGVMGVMLLTTGGKRMGPLDFLRALRQPAARTGIVSGTFFAFTAIFIRDATGDVVTRDSVQAALVVLVATLALQTVIHGTYVVLHQPEQVRPIFTSWRISGQVGLLSALGSACWFTGFATAPVALVRIVGQIEVFFTLSFSHFYLRERLGRGEAAGLMLVAAGVVLALAGAWLG